MGASNIGKHWWEAPLRLPFAGLTLARALEVCVLSPALTPWVHG